MSMLRIINGAIVVRGGEFPSSSSATDISKLLELSWDFEIWFISRELRLGDCLKWIISLRTIWGRYIIIVPSHQIMHQHMRECINQSFKYGKEKNPEACADYGTCRGRLPCLKEEMISTGKMKVWDYHVCLSGCIGHVHRWEARRG